MKKMRVMLLAAVFSLLMACSAFAADTREITNKTAIYLVEKSDEAMANVTSLKMEGFIDIMAAATFDGGADIIEGTVGMEILMEMPGRMFMRYGMTVDDDMADYEIYMDANGLYVRTPLSFFDEWVLVLDDDEMGGFLSAAMSGDETVAEELISQSGLNLDRFTEELESSYHYEKNVKYDGNSYYVVSCSVDMKSLLLDMRDYMESIYSSMDALSGDSYTEEIMSMYDLIVSRVKGAVDMDMYINKETYYTDYIFMNMNMDLDFKALIGMGMEMDFDFFLQFSEYNSKDLPFPNVEVQSMEDYLTQFDDWDEEDWDAAFEAFLEEYGE